MQSANYVVARCLCVRLSVCHDPVLRQNGLTYRKNSFTALQHQRSSFLRIKSPSETPTVGGECTLCVKNSAFSANKPLYLGNRALRS